MRAEKLRVVSAFDEAIDADGMTAEQMGAYLKTREPGLIEPYLKPGSRPTWYTLREIEHGLWERYVDAPEGDAEKYRRAFQCSVLRVENLYQSDGTCLPLWEAPTKEGAAMPEEMLARFAPQERLEIGRVAYLHSFFHRRTKCSFVPPHTFLTLLAGRGFRPADVSLTSPVASSSEASQQAESARPEPAPIGHFSATTVGGFGSLTAATATGPRMEMESATQ